MAWTFECKFCGYVGERTHPVLVNARICCSVAQTWQEEEE